MCAELENLLPTVNINPKVVEVALTKWLLSFFFIQEPSWLQTTWATAAQRCPSGAHVTAVGMSCMAVSVFCICSATTFVCVSKRSQGHHRQYGTTSGCSSITPQRTNRSRTERVTTSRTENKMHTFVSSFKSCYCYNININCLCTSLNIYKFSIKLHFFTH